MASFLQQWFTSEFISPCDTPDLKNQIQAMQVQQVAENSEIANFARLVKSAVGVFSVYITVLVCYAPHFISLVCLKINGPTIALQRFFLLSLVLVFLNSSLNPVIYCWKMRHIRQTLLNILRNILSLNSHINCNKTVKS